MLAGTMATATRTVTLRNNKVRSTTKRIKRIGRQWALTTAVVVVLCLLASCQGNVVFHNYQPLSQDGWDRHDKVTFSVDTILQPGSYITFLCLRTTSEYPYRNFAATISQTVKHKDSKTDSKGKPLTPPTTLYRKALGTEIIAEDGTAEGTGVTFYTQEIPVFKTNLTQQDAVQIDVKHDMRREIMPGIADIGIKLVREE